MISSSFLKAQYVTGQNPIPVPPCPDAPELAGARSLPSSHSESYGFLSGPASRHICPASSLGILVQYTG
jgi:hypothetical protein